MSQPLHRAQRSLQARHHGLPVALEIAHGARRWQIEQWLSPGYAQLRIAGGEPAYDLVGTYRGAARLAGCDHHTVQRYVERREAAADPAVGVPRPSMIDGFRAKIEELVERSEGDSRADVVHERLVAMGFDGTARTTRRVVAEAKK